MQKPNLPKWQTTQSKYIVNDRWLKLRADSCVDPDGNVIEPWYVIEQSDWVNCLVIDESQNVILLWHYRHAIDDYDLEIPAGAVDDDDSSPEAAIARELREELGYEGGELYRTGVMYANPSNQTNLNYTFITIGGSCTSQTQKELGADYVMEKIPLKDFLAEVTNPDKTIIYQSLHLSSIFLALNFIKNGSVESDSLRRIRDAIDAIQT